MDQKLLKKYTCLQNILKKYGSAAVAFSGGVDSTLLSKVAHDVLGENAAAITVNSEAYAPEDIIETRRLAKLIGIALIEIKESVCDIQGFADNLPDRCYHCKHALFTAMKARTEKDGYAVLADGSNTDDLGDYRPGKRALGELGIASPLMEAGFSKDNIRALSRELDLPTWDRPSFACLASRFPYGDKITAELLERTWRAEKILKDLGISVYRVRNHGDIARIEVDREGMDILMTPAVRKDVAVRLKQLGYNYVTLDIEEFRTGRMNEVLGDQDNNV